MAATALAPETVPAASDSVPARTRSLRSAIALVSLAVVLAGAFALSVAVGSVWIPPGQVVEALRTGLTETEAWGIVIRDVRLPRAFTALVAGAALGIAGLQMQTLFRNPLADPYVLGVSSGASLGVALVVLAGAGGSATVFAGPIGFLGDVTIAGAAILGAVAVLALILPISARLVSPATILVVGLMFGYGVSAFVTVLVARADSPQLQRWIAWGFGSFSGVTWNRLAILAPIAAAGVLLALMTTKQLNALLLGERYARSMGLSVRRMRVLTMVGASLLGGIVTAYCGPIAFLGIAVPHMCRAVLGTSDHRVLAPAVVLMGGTVALLAQVVSLLPGHDGILPLNAVTALIGAPIVVLVLLRNRKGVFAG